jgi:signal transduction histidine kinase
MCFVRLRFLHTESFRLTTIFAGLLIGTVLALMAIVFVIMHQAFRTELSRSADHELMAIHHAYATEGVREAKEVVTQLLAKSDGSHFLLLESKDKGKLAGNIPALAPFEGERVIRVKSGSHSDPEDEDGRRIIGRGVNIAPGLFAFAGRDLSIAEDTEESVLHAFGWVLAGALLLALGAGVVLSNSFLGRMDAITRTCRAIIAGHFADRVPERGTRDELDQLAQTINMMLGRIAALMENIKQISSDIAHDLRTPLTRLRHRLELARAESETAKEYAEAMDRAIEDSEGILSTFSALLKIGQIEGGAERKVFAEVALSALLTELSEVYRPAAEDAGYILEARVEPGIAVAGDRELLSQMFVNLIENAMAHTPSGTTITLTLKKNLEGEVVATVADNGPGVPPEEREKVLRRFYRLEQARSRPGSGLGLSLVAAIAGYHGAEVSLEDNEPGLRVSIAFG